MNRLINYTPYLIIIVVFSYFSYIIHEMTRPDPTLYNNTKVDSIEDTLSSLRQELILYKERDSILNHQFDSLKKLPPIIKTQTIEKIKVINSSTDVNQLDSIIRTNW